MNPFEKDWKETPSAEPLPPETWAILELKGFTKLAGRISEEERFGCKVGRIDVPMHDGSFVTKFFHGSSVHCCTIVSERVARHVAQGTDAKPVGSWDFPKMLASPEEGEPGASPIRAIRDRGDRCCSDCGEIIEECICEHDDDPEF